MLLDFIGAFATGLGLLAVVFSINHLTGKWMGRWVFPATVAFGMMGYTAWAEYSWSSRTINALSHLRLASSARESVPWRPWTYAFPQVNRMIAVDLSRTRVHPNQPDLVMTDLVLLGRWEPVRSVPVIFDCAANTRADLIEDVVLNTDGSVEGATWEAMEPDNSVLTTACAAGQEVRNGASS